MTRAALALLHAVVVAGVYCVCPVGGSGDSRWVVPEALQLAHHGTTRLDIPYDEAELRLERVSPEGAVYVRYPAAVAAVAAVFLPVIEAVSWAGRRFGGESASSPVRRAFLAGDFAGSYTLVEMLIASILMAIAAGFQFLTAIEFLPAALASLVTFVFAFATPVWSTASRALWNHTPALLMLSVALYLLVLSRRRPELIQYVSIPLAAAFTMRPAMALAVLFVTAYVAMYERRWLAAYCVWAMPIAGIFFGYNLATRHQLFQTYFVEAGQWPDAPWPERLGIQLISPSRGLFIFSPVLLFSIAGMWLAWRRRWLWPLTPWLIALVAAHVLLVAKYFWPGVSYGPRYYTELIPLFTLFLIPVLRSLARPAWIVFATLLLWSVFVHARGAIDMSVYDWNTKLDMAYVWNWRDPQFLHGLR